MEKCEVNAQKIEHLDKRVSKLEEQREKDKSQIHQLDTSLQIFINEMHNISSELKTIVSNFKEAILRSTATQEKELAHLKEKVVEIEKKTEKTDSALAHIDERITKETIGENAKKWKDITKYIITTVIGGIIAFLFLKLGLK